MIKNHVLRIVRAPMDYPFLASMMLCVAVIASILIYAQGLPYVTDGNESFSAYRHARSLLQWGPTLAMGLTDEATTDERAGHPYIYTHEGNFPRFFSTVLLLLRIDAIEWHIVLASLLVGGASAYLCFRLFSRVAGGLFALIACAVFWTDYLLFVQWQVNTYRVWHSLLLFASVHCVLTINDENKKRMSLLLFLNSLVLFYFEYVFAVFVVLFSAAYAIMVHRNRLNRVLWVLGATVGGGMTSVALFAVQLVSHLGIDLATQDIRLTYFARNFAKGDAPHLRAQVMQFYLDHHIVFWDVFDTKNYLTLATFFKSVGATVLQVYTPFFVLSTCTVLLGALVSAVAYRRGLLKERSSLGAQAQGAGKLTVRRWGSALWRWGLLVAAVWLVGGMLSEAASSQFQIATPDGLRTFSAIGFAHRGLGPLSPLWLAASVAFTGLLLRVFIGTALGVGEIPRGRLWLSVAFIGVVGVYMLTHRLMYDTRAIALWYWTAQGFWPRGLLQVVLLLSVFLGVALIFGCGDRCLWQVRGKSLHGILQYLAAGSLAFVGVYLLFPGYLYGGYLLRYAPIPVFVSDVAIALFFYLLATLVREGWRAALARYREESKVRAPQTILSHVHAVVPAMALCVLSACVGVFASVYWVRLQAIYVSNLPPTMILFMKRLGEPGFKGASFVSDNYALPIAYFTNRWAYQDHEVAENQFRATEDGGRLQMSGKYIWFADRDTNNEYLRPQYYLCRINATLDTVAELVAMPPGRRLSNCSAQAIFRAARAGGSRPLQHTLVDYDRGRLDGWAVIELDGKTRMAPAWTSSGR